MLGGFGSIPGALLGVALLRYLGTRLSSAAIDALVDAYQHGDAPAALECIEELVAGGGDAAQIAGQAQDVARTRLLAAAGDPGSARHLAAMLRRLSEAAGAGGREGRARLTMELLSVEMAGADAASPSLVRVASAPVATRGAGVATPAAPIANPEEPIATPPAPPAPGPQPDTPRAGGQPSPAAGSSSAPISPRAAGGRPSLEEIRRRWAEVVDGGTPVIKPLLRECRPFALDGARLKLAFPEGREFMRERISSRAGAIEQLLAGIFGQSWAVECVATNVELEPLALSEAVVADADDSEGRALLEGVLKITGGELVDAPEVR